MKPGHGGMAGEEVARQIQAYLASHPNAHDTLEGIMEWWLLEQRIDCESKVVKEALASLVATGRIVAHQKSDGRVSYRANTRPAISNLTDHTDC